MRNELDGAQCVVYQRISWSEQSTYSLSAQERTNGEFAARNKMRVLASFTDDGVSASSFDRGDWQKLCAFVKANKVRFIVVAAYDRFSRNAGEALTLLNKFEKKLNCTVISATQYIGIPSASPSFFVWRADLLVRAEFEHRLIRERTANGIREAHRQGRHVNNLPHGYKWQKGEKGKSIVVPHPEKSLIVRQMAEMCIQGYTDTEIQKHAARMGMILKGHSTVERILTNRFYTGFVFVPERGEEPAQWVQGQHEPIFTIGFFNDLQNARSNKKSKIKNADAPQTPLRGVISCQCCGNMLTGGPSRGKAKKVYYYYRCLKCTGQNFATEKAHAELLEVLDAMQMDEKLLRAIKSQTAKYLAQSDQERRNELQAAMQSRDELKNRLEKMEVEYLTGKIAAVDVFQKWREIWGKDIADLEYRITALQSDEHEKRIKTLNEVFPKLANIRNVYDNAGIHHKRAILRFLFPQGLEKTGKGYRTPGINTLFVYNFHKTSALDINKTGTSGDMSQEIPVSSPYGNNIEHFFTLAQILQGLAA